MRGRAISEFLDHLAEGDPVALGFVIGFAIVALLAGLLVLKIRRDLRREDEAQARKYGRKPSK